MLFMENRIIRKSVILYLSFFPMHFIPCNASWMTECYKMSKLEKTFQVDCKWGMGIRQWLKCQAVTFSNKGLNHNVSDSLSSSCWKSKWMWGENKKNVSSNFLSSTSITEAFCSLTFYNNEHTLISCHWITIVYGIKRSQTKFACDKEKNLMSTPLWADSELSKSCQDTTDSCANVLHSPVHSQSI